ncbi:MAG: ATP-binding protein [Candidatus Geothermincolia bacterium]
MEEGRGRADGLLDFIKGVSSERAVRVEEDLGHGFVRLRITEAERRQALQDVRSVEDAVKEMFRNARDAGARMVLVAFQKERGRYRHITIIDDGCGIPDQVQARIFDSRVTSKVEDVLSDAHGVHGRGMALFSIRSASDVVKLVCSEPGAGTAIHAVIDTSRIPEKKDQSTWPRVTLDATGRPVVAGTRNVPRLLTEFAIERPLPAIYFGSNAEILATLRSLAHWRDEGELFESSNLWRSAGDINDGRNLAAWALERVGLEVSERNAFRILEGGIKPVPPVHSWAVAGEQPEIVESQQRRQGAWRSGLAKRLGADEMDELARKVAAAVDELGAAYFLKVTDPAKVRVRRRKDRLVITLPLAEDDIETG